jgi:hypothetical protein
MGRLPKTDQHWILRQLHPEHLVTLTKNQGLNLLKEAQRFRKIKEPVSEMTTKSKTPDSLPNYCHELAQKTPLYIAIVLDQGCYSWVDQFLYTYDQQGVVQSLMKNQVCEIKPAVKSILFQEWIQSGMRSNEKEEAL